MSKVRTQVMLDLDVFNSIILLQQELKCRNISQTINKFIKKTIMKTINTDDMKSHFIWRLEEKDEEIKNLKYEIRVLKGEKIKDEEKKL